MKVPSTVLWRLTKRWNSFLVKDIRVSKNSFSKDPLNSTGLHNASASGLANEHSVGVDMIKEKSKKKHRRVIVVNQNHKDRNAQKKVGKAGLVYSTFQIKKEVNHAAKAIQNFTHLTDAQKKRALKKLQALHNANRVNATTRKTIKKN
jgi:hypothetical protein